jgi:hypothetical protein
MGTSELNRASTRATRFSASTREPCPSENDTHSPPTIYSTVPHLPNCSQVGRLLSCLRRQNHILRRHSTNSPLQQPSQPATPNIAAHTTTNPNSAHHAHHPPHPLPKMHAKPPPRTHKPQRPRQRHRAVLEARDRRQRYVTHHHPSQASSL